MTQGNPIQQYDYIIIGAGCSGLSLAVRLAADRAFVDKKILLIDKGPKSTNDRTWCFWEQGEGYFESIVHHQWSNLWVKHFKGSQHLNLHGYRYKLIRGIDFYSHCFDALKQAKNVHIHFGAVTDVNASEGTVTAGGATFAAGHIFSSVLLQQPQLQPGEYYLLQHFRGWWIETETPAFDRKVADLMNFRTSQQHGCAFMYVLPVSDRRALVEYTLFTEDELEDNAYNEALSHFISEEMKLPDYKVTEIENGVIPMTNMRFPQQQNKISFIGTAGGQTKASSGYTFQFIQKQSEAIVASLRQGKVDLQPASARFRFYDSVLLRVLHERKMDGADVFLQLFQKNPAPRVLRFLDNESNLWDEWLIMNSTPKNIFIPAAMAELRK